MTMDVLCKLNRRGNARRTGPADFSGSRFLRKHITRSPFAAYSLSLASPPVLSLRQPPTLITWKCLRRIEAGLFKEWSLRGWTVGASRYTERYRLIYSGTESFCMHLPFFSPPSTLLPPFRFVILFPNDKFSVLFSRFICKKEIYIYLRRLGEIANTKVK